MGMEIGSAKFRNLEHEALKDGKITAKEAKDLGKAAKKEDAAVAKQLLSDDAFENTDARKAFATAAGVKTKDLKAIPKNTIAGQMVGGAAVLRTLGDPKGYANALEAIASARQTGVSNAAVVKQGDRFYAVELSKEQSGSLSTAGATGLSQAIGVPNYDQATVDSLRSQLAAERQNGASADPTRVADLQKQLAAAITGLPKDSFEVIGKDSSRVETTFDPSTGIPSGINIQNGLFDETHGAMGTHSPAGVGGEGFDPAKGTAVSIDAGELEGRTRVKDELVDGKPKHTTWFEQPSNDSVLGVLQHEATHLEDQEEARAMVNQWQKDTGGTFVVGGQNADFQGWLAKKLKKDPAKLERVSQMVRELHNETEGHAHVATAIDAIRNGAPEVAKEQLIDYAKALAGSPPQPHEKDKILADATAAYKLMSKEQKKEFKAAIKAANDAVGEDSPLYKFDPDKFKPSKH